MNIYHLFLAQATALLTVVSASAVTLDVPRLTAPAFADWEVSGDADMPAGASGNLRRFRLELAFCATIW